MITLSGTLVLSLILSPIIILIFILSWSVFKLSSYISVLFLKKINYQIKINNKQLNLLSATASIGIVILFFLSVYEYEYPHPIALFDVSRHPIAVYLLIQFIIFLLITVFFKFKKIALNHFNLLYLFSSIVSLILLVILFYLLMGYIYFFKADHFGALFVFIPAVVFLALLGIAWLIFFPLL